ncbi:MAG: replication-associated recombination protein A [Thermoguttaceae bacterium]|jgi:putative ATPase
MSSLFDASERENRMRALPLAARMRPTSLNEFVGQEHFLGEGKLLRRLLKSDRLGSVIFFGPPGTGKTTLAYILARETRSYFRQMSAVSDGVKQLRDILGQAKDRLSAEGRRTLLFVDEIHRFNKAQQDVLLPEVEQGIVTLIGATTENPFFTINNALLSRSRIFQFEPLEVRHIVEILNRAIRDKERGLGSYPVNLHPDAAEYLGAVCDGDARRALSTLEIGVLSSLDEIPHDENGNRIGSVEFTKELAAESLQRRLINYDRDGDNHYDTISALIKSIRGSDPDAAIYWLARMLEGGEDVRFLARRLVILASEDVGNADPHALPMAVAAAQACELVGLPECQFNLAQTVIYLAVAPKSNSATNAIFGARGDIKEGRILPVPRFLRDANYRGSQQFGHTGYQYAHDSEGAIAAADYLGVDREYYVPTDRGYEQEMGKRLVKIKAILKQAPPNNNVPREYVPESRPIREREITTEEPEKVPEGVPAETRVAANAKAGGGSAPRRVPEEAEPKTAGESCKKETKKPKRTGKPKVTAEEEKQETKP